MKQTYFANGMLTKIYQNLEKKYFQKNLKW